MNVTVVALLGLALAQPPAEDYYFLNTRSIKFPISYAKDPKTVRKVELYACKNGDQVWQLVAVAPPTQPAFFYTAPEDGRYWFHIVIEDLKGGKDPSNLTTEAPAKKVVFDTKPPAVVFTDVRRRGEEVQVQWKVDDLFPTDEVTRVYFRPATATESWQEVTIPTHPKSGGRLTGVKFPTRTTEPLVLRVVVSDLAGNTAEGIKEVPAAGAASTTSLSPGTPGVLAPPTGLAPSPSPVASVTPPAAPLPVVTQPGSLASPGLPVPPADVIIPLGGGGPIAPVAPPSPVAPADLAPPAPGPVVPAVTTPAVLAMPPAPAVTPVMISTAPTPPTPVMISTVPTPPVPAAIPSGPAVLPTTPGSTQPVQTFDPRTAFASPAGGGPAPAGPPAGGGPTPSASPVMETTRVPVINSPRFDLNYQVEQKGPSGISRVDLWVTRDDGKSWVWWSKHEGREAALTVNLGTPAGTDVEGRYGFRLVPISGAGLSEATPVAGDAPDIRVVVDVTPPAVRIFPPASDPAAPDALVIKWEATDRNFGDDPITLEWSDGPSGPWRPVVSAGDGAVVQTAAVSGATTRRLPNTGSYGWRVPAGMPPRVYLKVTARDAAGNTTEQVTTQPLLIDLMKPRAKILGIGGPVPTVRP